MLDSARYCNASVETYPLPCMITLSNQQALAGNSITSLLCPLSFGDNSVALATISLFINVGGNGELSVEFAGGNGYRSSASQIVTGKWYHFVVTKSAGAINTTTTMYLDGSVISSAGEVLHKPCHCH